MTARDELTAILDATLSQGTALTIEAFRDKYHPELPDGAIELAPGWHFKDAPGDGYVYLYAPEWTGRLRQFCRDELRAYGQPIPEPTPEITVGCIVHLAGGADAREVVAIGGDEVWTRARNGRHLTYGLEDLTYVAASWDEVPA